MYRWRTDDRGLIEVDAGDGAGFVVPVTEGRDAEKARVLQLVPSALRPAAEAEGVPLAWLCAIALTESGGDPSAVGATGDFGLMQIIRSNWAWLGLSEENWMDPAVNAMGAAKQIRAILDRKPSRIRNFPEVCSVYNAGGDAKTGEPYPSTSSPWGMRETPGSTIAKVRANNWFVREFALVRGASGAGAAAALLALGGLVWLESHR